MCKLGIFDIGKRSPRSKILRVKPKCMTFFSLFLRFLFIFSGKPHNLPKQTILSILHREFLSIITWVKSSFWGKNSQNGIYPLSDIYWGVLWSLQGSFKAVTMFTSVNQENLKHDTLQKLHFFKVTTDFSVKILIKYFMDLHF